MKTIGFMVGNRWSVRESIGWVRITEKRASDVWPEREKELPSPIRVLSDIVTE